MPESIREATGQQSINNTILLHAQLSLARDIPSPGSKESLGYPTRCLFSNTPRHLCEKLRPKKSQPTFATPCHRATPMSSGERDRPPRLISPSQIFAINFFDL